MRDSRVSIEAFFSIFLRDSFIEKLFEKGLVLFIVSKKLQKKKGLEFAIKVQNMTSLQFYPAPEQTSY